MDIAQNSTNKIDNKSDQDCHNMVHNALKDSILNNMYAAICAT